MTAESPVASESRNLRTAVLMDDRTDLLRRRAFSLVLIRLIWDLIFATRAYLFIKFITDPHGPAQEAKGYQRTSAGLKLGSGRPGHPDGAQRLFKGVDRVNRGPFYLCIG